MALDTPTNFTVLASSGSPEGAPDTVAGLSALYGAEALGEICGHDGPGYRATVATLKFVGPARGAISMDRHRLFACLENVGGGVIVCSEPATASRPMRGDRWLSLVPAGKAARIDCEGPCILRLLVVDFEDDAMERLPEQHGKSCTWSERRVFTDSRIFALCQLIAAECTQTGIPSRQFVGALVLGLLRYLSNHYTDPLACGGLSPTQLRRVTEYARANISTGILISELAALIGVSASHFRRAFKITTGASPQRWLMQERCEVAKELLLQEVTLAEAALEVGSCDQAHFTRMFRRLVGKSPGRWRREALVLSGQSTLARASSGEDVSLRQSHGAGYCRSCDSFTPVH